MASPFRAKAPHRSTWRICILLLSVGLMALAMLAKHSFSEPYSSSTHWISQTCKIVESRLSAPLRSANLQAAITPLRQERRTSTTAALVVPQSDAPPHPSPDYFSSASLRSPPSLL